MPFRTSLQRVQFQTPSSVSSVSFFSLTEFRGANSVSSSQPIICVPKRTHRVCRRTHRVCPQNSVRLSEFSCPKQYSRNSIPPVSKSWNISISLEIFNLELQNSPHKIAVVTAEHWTGSPNKSIDQIRKNCPKMSEHCVFTPSGHFFDIFRHFRTFCRHSLSFFGLSSALPVTKAAVGGWPFQSRLKFAILEGDLEFFNLGHNLLQNVPKEQRRCHAGKRAQTAKIKNTRREQDRVRELVIHSGQKMLN